MCVYVCSDLKIPKSGIQSSHECLDIITFLLILSMCAQFSILNFSILKDICLGWLVGWFVKFYGYINSIGYVIPIPLHIYIYIYIYIIGFVNSFYR